jgi:hypothetical protein
MSVFSEIIQSVDSDHLNAAFKVAIKSLSLEQLQLQQAVKNGSIALADGITVMVISQQHNNDQLRLKAGIFFRSIIAGCNCADDPSPVETLEEYAEAWFSISKKDGSFRISLV